MEVAAVGAATSFSLADVNFDDNATKEGSQFTCVGLMTLILAGGAATLAIISMAIASSNIVTVAGVITIVMTPIVLVQRFQLNRMDTLRQVHNALRQDVNRLTIENSELEHQTTRLTEKADQVKIMEGKLQTMVGSQGSSVDSFVGMVQENAKVLESMEALLAAQVAQQLMSTVVQTDHNLDFKLSNTEINELILRVSTMNGVEAVDEQELRRVLTRSNGLEGVYSIIQSMLDSKKKSLIQVSSRSLVF